MKKINLKSILKKTFKKKKKVKKVKTKNKKVPKKIIKKVGRPKILKNEISNKKDIKKNIGKSENLKLTKTLDQKPEIVKIKKQGTEKREYKVKDYVVYPKHGVGQILSVNAKKLEALMCNVMILNLKKTKLLVYCQLTNNHTCDLYRQLIK